MTRTLAAVFLALAVLIAGCSGKSHSQSPSTSFATTAAATQSPTAGINPSPAAPSSTPGPSVALTPHPLGGAVPYPADSLADLRALEQRTAELRGLEPTADVPAYLISRDAAADYLVSTIEPDDKASIELHQEVYRLLGLVPPDADLLALELSLLKSAVLGFYDPDVKSLFILDDLGFTSPVTRLTLVHEFTHALQDQHYGITSHQDALKDDWDGEAAWTDLLEGDARSMETIFLSPTTKPPLSRFCHGASFSVNSRSGVPPVIQRELNTPYTDGLCFVRTVGPQLPRGDDSIFENPPASTEQILHPDKYLAHEAVRKIDLPNILPNLGAGWQQIGTSNLGEFTIQNLLLLGISDQDKVTSAAAGWAGDRWVLYGNGDARLIEVRIAWDSADEAMEFWNTFVPTLVKRSKDKLKADATSKSVTWDQDGKFTRAAITGDTVTLLTSTDGNAARAVSGTLGLP